jgi:hypothetical protein
MCCEIDLSELEWYRSASLIPNVFTPKRRGEVANGGERGKSPIRPGFTMMRCQQGTCSKVSECVSATICQEIRTCQANGETETAARGSKSGCGHGYLRGASLPLPARSKRQKLSKIRTSCNAGMRLFVFTILPLIVRQKATPAVGGGHATTELS